MFFWNKFCGLLAIFFIFGPCGHAQNSLSFVSSNNHFIVKNKMILSDSLSTSSLHFFNKATEVSTISPDFSTCNYGFFCKEELKIEKATKVPFRIRLGSLQQCNYYEGKR
jgi:hypothetical protein